MAERHISFEQLSDVMAFRIIVDDVAECYRALGLIHRRWPMVYVRNVHPCHPRNVPMSEVSAPYGCGLTHARPDASGPARYPPMRLPLTPP